MSRFGTGIVFLGGAVTAVLAVCSKIIATIPNNANRDVAVAIALTALAAAMTGVALVRTRQS